MLQRYGNVEYVLGTELVIDLIRGGTVANRGSVLQVNTDCYAVGLLERKTRSLPELLWKANCVFALRGERRKEHKQQDFYCYRTKMWKFLSWKQASKLKESLCNVPSLTKVNCSDKSKIVALTVYWIISTLIKRVQTKGL